MQFIISIKILMINNNNKQQIFLVNKMSKTTNLAIDGLFCKMWNTYSSLTPSASQILEFFNVNILQLMGYSAKCGIHIHH
jgi:hypothetical protein